MTFERLSYLYKFNSLLCLNLIVYFAAIFTCVNIETNDQSRLQTIQGWIANTCDKILAYLLNKSLQKDPLLKVIV